MQPNDPFQPAPSGIDYLNQIAPPEKPQGFDKKSKIIMLIFGIIGILSLIFIFVMATSQSSGPSPLKLAARLQKLQTISTKYDSKLRGIDLQTANSSLIAVLTTANQSISTPLASYSIDTKKQAKEITGLDSSSEIEKTLDDKFLESGGLLDNYYASEMNAQLTDTILMMQRLERGTKYKSMREFLKKNLADFENLQKQFEKVSTS